MSVFSEDMLKKIGLNQTESQVYAALATNYFRTVEEVQAYSKLKKSEVASALEELEKKKFVRKIEGKVDLFIAINPHLTVTSEAEKRLEKDLNAVSNSIREVWSRVSKELQSNVTNYVVHTRETSSAHTKELNSKVSKLIEETKVESRSQEEQVLSILTNFTSQVEGTFTNRSQKTAGEFEKQGNAFLQFSEEQNTTLKENMTDFEAQIVDIATNSVREKPIEAIINYRENVQSQSISRLEEISNRINNVKDQFNDLQTAITNLIEEGRSTAHEVIDGQGQKSVETFSKNIDQLDQTLNEIETTTTNLATDLLSQVKETLSPLQESLINIVTETSESTSASVKGTASSLTSSLEEVKGNVNDAISTSKESIDTTSQNMDESVSNSTTALQTYLDNVFQGSPEVEGLEKEIGSKTKITLEEMEKVREDFKQSLDDLQKAITDAVEKVGKTLAQGVNNSISDVSGKFDSLRNLVREQLESLEAAGDMVIGQMQSTIGSAIDSLAQQSSEKAKKTSDSIISEDLGRETEMLKVKIEEASSVLGKIVSEIKNIQETFKKTFQTETELQKSSTIKTITNKIKSTQDQLASSIDKIKNTIVEEFDQLREKVPQDVELMVEDQKNQVMHINMDIRGALGEVFMPLSELIAKGPDETKKYLKKKDQFEEFYSILKKGVDEAPTLEAKIESTLNKNVEGFSKAVDNYLNFFSKTVSDTGQNVHVLLEETALNSTNDTKELQHEILSEFDDYLKVVEEKFQKSGSNTLNETEKIVKNVNENLSSISTSIQETSERMSTKLSELSDFIGHIAEQSRKGSVTQLGEFESTMKSAIRNIIDQSVEQVGLGIDDLLKELENTGRSQKEQINIEITSSGDNSKETFQNASKSFSEALDKSKRLVETLREEIQSSLINTLTELSSEFGSLRSTLSEAQQKQLDELIKSNESIQAAVMEMFDRNKEEITNVTSGLLEEKENNQNTARSNIDQEFNNFETNLSNTTNKQAELTKEFGKMKKFLSEKRETSLSALSESIKKSQDSQKDAISKNLEIFLKELIQIFNQAQKSFSDENETLTQLRTSLHKELETISDNWKREYERLSDDLNSKIKQLSKSSISKYDSTFLDYKGNMDKFVTENKNQIKTEFKEIITSTRKLAEELSEKLTNRIKNVTEQISSITKETTESIPSELDSLVAEIDTKTTALVKELSEVIGQEIDSIPEKMRSGLEKTGSVMQFIRAVHDMASSAPPNPIESIYYVTGKDPIYGTIAGGIGRTKTAINIIIPEISALPVDAIKALPKTRRVQVLASIDDMAVVKAISDMGNVQLRELTGEESAIGFFRDGEEEGAIGAGRGEKGNLIVTTDSELVKTMNQLFADLWPRGRKL